MERFETIWAISADDYLEARETLHMIDDGEPAFIRGKKYRVLRMLPLCDPPVAVVNDDTAQENKVDADFLRYFRHIRK